MNRKAFIMMAIMALIITMPLRGYAVIIERVVAVVNNDVITLTELQERAILIRQASKKPDVPLKEVLKHIIIETIQIQRAKELDLNVSDDIVDKYIEGFKKENKLDDAGFRELLGEWGITLNAYKEEVRRRILISKLINLEVKSRIAVPEEDIRSYYEQHKDELYQLAPKAHVADIFLPWANNSEVIEKMAEGIVKRIELGESFKKMATLYSKDPNAPEGGDMGWIRKGESLKEIDDFVFNPDTHPGDIKMVETPQGIHILKMIERQNTDYVPFDEVKEEIEKKLYAQRAKARYNKWLDGLVKKAYVDIKDF